MGFLRSALIAIFGRDRRISIQIPFGWIGFKMSQYHFFKDEETKGLDKELCAMLDWARGRAGVPFIITRGLSTILENDKVGGVQDSAHLKGLGVDLACTDSNDRFKMVQALLLAGFRRIGIYTDGHIHADRDLSLPQDVIWIK